MSRSATYDHSGGYSGTALAQSPLAHVTAPMLPVGDAVYTAFDAVYRTVANAAAAVGRHYRIRATVKAVSALEDHMLSDIGVHRSQIQGLANFVVDHPGADPRKAVR